MPLLSVCVITYNQENYIKNCIQSIIDQDVEFEFEIIIGDDCSNDLTCDIIQNEFLPKYKNIKLIRQAENSGGTRNLYDVYEASNGFYIAHVDGDDVLLPGKLQKQIDFFRKHPICSVVAHDARIVDDIGGLICENFSDVPVSKITNVEDLVLRGTFFTHSSKMFKRSAMISRFRNRPTVDFYLHIEHALSGPIGYINEVLCEYRQASGISSLNGVYKYQVLVAHLEAYDLARKSNVRKEIVEAAELNFRYVQGMMALRAGRYDLYKFVFSKGLESKGNFSRYLIFASLRNLPSLARWLVKIYDRLRDV